MLVPPGKWSTLINPLCVSVCRFLILKGILWLVFWGLILFPTITAALLCTAASLDRRARCWSPPAAGCWKINMDAAIDSARGGVGVGIIVRNHLGQLAEGVAMLLGICFTAESGLCPASLESDATVVVSAFGLILHDIISAVNRFHISSISFAPRVCNQAAHALAKLALTLESNLFLMDCVPPSVEYVTLADMPK
ncbi:hypothetical protein ACOSQ3_012617 [Xanthoceras sorbifolium]